MPKSSPKKPDKLEFAPDAWERFESLVKSAAKMGHQPHRSTPTKKRSLVKKKAKKSA